MPVKRTTNPITGNTVCFGRRRPTTSLRFHLRDYLVPVLPCAPPAMDYTAKAATALAQMYGNDILGDCVEAGQLHLDGVLTGNAGDEAIFTLDQAIALYSSEGGYVDGDPGTDNGTDEVTALNDWVTNGLLPGGSHKIAGSLLVDASNVSELQSALWLFENLCFGLELPDAWVSPFPSESGFVWDVAGPPDPDNGHFVIGAAYNAQGVTISTWAMLGILAYAAIAEYCSEANGGAVYVVISPDQIDAARQKAPNGLNWTQLMADFAIAGGVATQPPDTNNRRRHRRLKRRRLRTGVFQPLFQMGLFQMGQS